MPSTSTSVADVNVKRGKFITFEGIDGAGKSTQLSWFAERIANAGHRVVVTREPGGTPLGEALRDIVLHQRMHLETEALLMFAGRREHLAEVIEPALARGDWVISDRFTDASFAYQGGGRGLPIAKLEVLEQWVHPHLQPDLTLLFDVAIETARARLAGTRDLDKFERQGDAFFEQTRHEYLRRAGVATQRFRLIDSNLSPENIRNQLEEIISSL